MNKQQVKSPMSVEALAKERLEGFARNHGLSLSADDRQMFLEDVESYREHEGMSLDEAVALACEAVRYVHC